MDHQYVPSLEHARLPVIVIEVENGGGDSGTIKLPAKWITLET